VARRIVDRDVLRLIKMWLQAPVEERDENGKRRLMGGKDRHCRTPQGGVASPMLANLYMNRLLKGWQNTKRGEQFDAHIVNYADDFVILSRSKAAEALNWTRQVVTRMGVTLNEAKTSIKQARQESFHFLIYVRAASLQEGWPLVFGGKSVEEGGGTHQGKGGRASGAQQHGDLGRGAGPAESDSEGLVGVLQLRNPGGSVSGGS
jgi:hypothetical protein